MTTATYRPIVKEIANAGLSSLDTADVLRQKVTSSLDADRQAALGQYFTGAATAKFMAGMFVCAEPHLRLLDAGAGVGSLTAAFVAEMCVRENRPESLAVTAYETDSELIPHLRETMLSCEVQCRDAGIDFSFQVIEDDFIAAGVEALGSGLFAREAHFNCAILNPPYRKLRSDSDSRRRLSSVGIETSNLYAAFVWLAMRHLQPGGELVAITPRSFCNGPYFKPFRVAINQSMILRRFHVFDSRTETFRDNDVLQENVIYHLSKKSDRAETGEQVIISSSRGPEDEVRTLRTVAASQVIRTDDRDAVINLVADEPGQSVADQMLGLPATLGTLGIAVSTGRVVDFRSREHLRMDPTGEPGELVAPLIYPLHFGEGFVNWPKPEGRKPNALAVTEETRSLLNPAGIYVLVKRFSSKEQKRRVVATIYDPTKLPSLGQSTVEVAFENHLNYFHENGAGLPRNLAVGLCAFLNSTMVDTYFRQFNGHTQVNATDLRSLRYPIRIILEKLGQVIQNSHLGETPTQEMLDRCVEEQLEWPSV